MATSSAANPCSDFSSISYAHFRLQPKHFRFVMVAVRLLLCWKARLVPKDKQIEMLEHLYNEGDVFLWVPTGYGKSQALPFLFDAKHGRTSAPLSQRSVNCPCDLSSCLSDGQPSRPSPGVGAAILSGNTGVDTQLQATSSDIVQGRYRLLYSSPEALFSTDQWTNLMMEPPLYDCLVGIAIDEAHCVYKWSEDFCPDYARLCELRAFAPCGVPILAATATVTELMRDDIISQLDIAGCKLVSASPNKPNIFYSVERRSGDVEKDMAFLVDDLAKNSISAKRVIVYCRSLRLCSSLYAHFLYTLGDQSYYPPSAEHVSCNRLFEMYHSRTDEHNKKVIMESMSKADGTCRVVFATMALGMGVNFVGLYSTIRYGAPRSLEDYFQESGRAGRDGGDSTSTIYWTPKDAPRSSVPQTHQQREVLAVRRYLEDESTCRRYMLLEYFDVNLAKNLVRGEKQQCCDNCQRISTN